jgi:hypothetical protein
LAWVLGLSSQNYYSKSILPTLLEVVEPFCRLHKKSLAVIGYRL